MSGGPTTTENQSNVFNHLPTIAARGLSCPSRHQKRASRPFSRDRWLSGARRPASRTHRRSEADGGWFDLVGAPAVETKTVPGRLPVLMKAMRRNAGESKSRTYKNLIFKVVTSIRGT